MRRKEVYIYRIDRKWNSIEMEFSRLRKVATEYMNNEEKEKETKKQCYNNGTYQKCIYGSREGQKDQKGHTNRK